MNQIRDVLIGTVCIRFCFQNYIISFLSSVFVYLSIKPTIIHYSLTRTLAWQFAFCSTISFVFCGSRLFHGKIIVWILKSPSKTGKLPSKVKNCRSNILAQIHYIQPPIQASIQFYRSRQTQHSSSEVPSRASSTRQIKASLNCLRTS